MKSLPTAHILTTFDTIAQVSSTLEKQRILSRCPESKPILKWAYNPYWNYYIRQYRISTIGDNDLNDRTFILLRNLRDRKITGNDAYVYFQEHLSTLNSSSQLLLCRIIDRDLRIGMNIKTINSVFPGLIPTFDVMLAQKINWNKVQYPCYSSIKLDGVRAVFMNDELFTRSGKLLVGLNHIRDQLRATCPDHDIDGELIVPGTSFQEGSGLIRSDNPVPTAEFHVFDVINKKVPFMERLNILGLMDRCSEKIVLVPHLLVPDREAAIAHYTWCRDKGFEGTVLKPFNYPYVQKRSPYWMKLKSIDSLDLKVVDYFEGTGKYRGMLGGIIVDFRGKEVRVGTGISDDQRESWWENRHKLIGHTAEVLYQEITPTDSLRHPRFLRWRHDK